MNLDLNPVASWLAPLATCADDDDDDDQIQING